MPDINFDCSRCGLNMDADEALQGMEVKCPECGMTLEVPTRMASADISEETPLAFINFDCTNCGQNMDADQTLQGLNVECPECGMMLEVPAGMASADISEETPLAFINFDCTNCGQNMDADQTLQGMDVECPRCGMMLEVPTGMASAGPVPRRVTIPRMDRVEPGESEGSAILRKVLVGAICVSGAALLLVTGLWLGSRRAATRITPAALQANASDPATGNDQHEASAQGDNADIPESDRGTASAGSPDLRMIPNSPTSEPTAEGVQPETSEPALIQDQNSTRPPGSQKSGVAQESVQPESTLTAKTAGEKTMVTGDDPGGRGVAGPPPPPVPKPGTAPAPPPIFREWTDVQGRKIQAEFIWADHEIVTIKTSDDKQFDLPMDRLAEADQAFVKTVMEDDQKRGTVRTAPIRIPAKLKQEANVAFASGFKYFIWIDVKQPVVREEGSAILFVPLNYVSNGVSPPAKVSFMPIFKRGGSYIAEGMAIALGDTPKMKHSGTYPAMHLDMDRKISGKGPCLIQMVDWETGNKKLSNEIYVVVDFK
jgi:DNA-directed RNA polymerase subunit RPC12/RpoP